MNARVPCVLASVLAAATGCWSTRPPLAPHEADPLPLRIACVGDSLTSGFQMEHPERDAYPAQLARRLVRRVVNDA